MRQYTHATVNKACIAPNNKTTVALLDAIEVNLKLASHGVLFVIAGHKPFPVFDHLPLFEGYEA